MTDSTTPKLTEAARSYIVRAQACFESPSSVRDAVRREFGVEVSRQAIERYDPTKQAGRDLGTKWAVLFETTRRAFIADTARIGIANRTVRLRALGRLAETAEASGNLVVAMQALEQAAKEMGGIFTNRRELTGRNQPAGAQGERAARIVIEPQAAANAYAEMILAVG